MLNKSWSKGCGSRMKNLKASNESQSDKPKFKFQLFKISKPHFPHL